MRTQNEIADRIGRLQDQNDDMFGFQRDVLMSCLAMEFLEPFLKDGGRKSMEEEGWVDPVFTEEVIRKHMLDYLEFAFDKCMGHRGISASRSVQKLGEWAWILGRDDLLAFAENDGNYPQYGAPILKKFAEEFGVEFPTNDAFTRMANG